jgi:hypothetical protein
MSDARAAAPPLDLASRVALRPAEAARALGVSERKLRELLPRLPHVRLDGVVMIPVDPLKRWLAEQARAEEQRAEERTRETLAQLVRSPRRAGRS